MPQQKKSQPDYGKLKPKANEGYVGQAPVHQTPSDNVAARDRRSQPRALDEPIPSIEVDLPLPHIQHRRSRGLNQPLPSIESVIESGHRRSDRQLGSEAIHFSSPVLPLPSLPSPPKPALPSHTRNVSGVYQPAGTSLAFPVNITTQIVDWPHAMVAKRPTYMPRNELGRGKMEEHFPQSRLPIVGGISLEDWYDALISAYNMIGRIDRCEYQSEYELRPLLQRIAQSNGRLLFWTPAEAMLHHNSITAIAAKNRDQIRNASLIVHLIRFPDGQGHFGVLIFDIQSQSWLFADSWKHGRIARFNLIAKRLQEWLIKSGLLSEDSPEDFTRNRGKIAAITTQKNSWTCGLIAIDFVRVFMRGGLTDWAAAYDGVTPEQSMIQQWLGWLHRELGHRPDTVVREPRVPDLNFRQYMREYWQIRTPPPSQNPAGRSQHSPMNLSSSSSSTGSESSVTVAGSPSQPSQPRRYQENSRSYPIDLTSPSPQSRSPPSRSPVGSSQHRPINLISPSPPSRSPLSSSPLGSSQDRPIILSSPPASP
ncbi:uncharacterized protein F4817DRAFT_336639 [Daldinia loculata]|uniref:uncharacterized protein n=1 Tax=Daldinia loculata TaxID=103429 RepID=UPI0020C53592|nr:uncharacterized protein F4817DRAFT_336639 [Daldinia loculata]KAI1647735.1 hypothetical protein F4817DRAFT_336639 [Daldinia loculata]